MTEDFIRDEKTYAVPEVEKKKCGPLTLPTFFEQFPPIRVSLNVRKNDWLTNHILKLCYWLLK